MRLTLFPKLLISFLALSLPPLVWLSVDAAGRIGHVGRRAVEQSTRVLDAKAEQALELQAVQLAREISRFLEDRVQDLTMLSEFPREPELFLSFSRARSGELWDRTRNAAGGIEERRRREPLYREISWIDRDGRETFRVEGSALVPKSLLRNVSRPEGTTFGVEDYFQAVGRLLKGSVYVGHVVGRHVAQDDQLLGAKTVEEAVGGREYGGIVRFAVARWVGGRFDGAVVLALDHRHLMEFTQHVLPLSRKQVVFPSYLSGNYAFLFDDEGWIVAHPKLWDIRGLDPTGKWVPAYTERSSAADVAAGRIPFRLDDAGFIHESYPLVARLVREGRSGVARTSNVSGVNKVMAYAPVFFRHGDYAISGVFGGVTIGALTEAFHREAAASGVEIARASRETLRTGFRMAWILAVAVVGAALWLSRAIARPIHTLAGMARKLAGGELSARVDVPAKDEVGDLAGDFNRMAGLLEEKDRRLLGSLEELEHSRDDARAYFEEASRERDFVEAVIASISTGLVTLDFTGRILSANPYAFETLGLPAAGARGRTLEECSVDAQLMEWVEALQRGAPLEARELDLLREGGAATFTWVPSRFQTEGGPGLILQFRDITAEKAMDRILERVDRLASLGRLAAGVAHEIRNPLTGISLALDDLHDRLEGEGDRGLVARSLQEIERLEGIVQSLLDYARVGPVEKRSLSLIDVVEGGLFLVKKAGRNQGVEVRVDVPPELPRVSGDPEKLKQAVLNLYLNALQAMPDGGVLSVSATAGDGEVCVRIADTGHGIPGAEKEKIFEPFYTLRPGGSGLGLSIAHTIVTDHEGRIEVSSELGEGTEFRLFLPTV